MLRPENVESAERLFCLALIRTLTVKGVSQVTAEYEELLTNHDRASLTALGIEIAGQEAPDE